MNNRTCIAGYSGSGKSTAARFLAGATDAAIIDADAEAKKFIAGDKTIVRRLIEVFGNSVLQNGELQFPFLGAMVFSSKEELLKYNAIVHPPFLPALRDLMDRRHNQAVIVDAALVPLWGLESWFDSRIWVHASFATRVLRVKSRSNNPEQGSVENRLCIQEEVMKEPGDEHWVHLENEGTFEELARAVNALL